MHTLIRIALVLIAGWNGAVGQAELLEMYSAEWCKYCQQAKRDLLPETELVDEYKLEIIDVDQSGELARENNIKTMPTFILRDDEGREIARQTGYHGLRKLKNWLAKHSHK
jgi:thioredoxin-related protein